MIWLNAIICKAYLWLIAIISQMAHCPYAGCMETAKASRAPQAADKYIVRLPDGMRDKINELAKSNNRSMNAEIVSMLQQAIEERSGHSVHALHTSGPDERFDVAALAAALAPQLATILAEELRKQE